MMSKRTKSNSKLCCSSTKNTSVKSKLLCCFTSCSKQSQELKYLSLKVMIQQYRLEIKTLTCDKLSHCLFDFDCVDLNVYERETYNYQEFSLDSLGALPSDKTSNVTNDSKLEMHIMNSI